MGMGLAIETDPAFRETRKSLHFDKLSANRIL